METWIGIFLPLAMLTSRIGGFFLVLPIFGWRLVPARVRAGTALLVTAFFAMILPAPLLGAMPVAPLAALVMTTQEILCGVALGLAASLVFHGVQVGGRFAGRQMGFAFASVVDPATGQQSAPIGVLFEMSFMMLFLAAGGHRLLLLAIRRSFDAFPVGQTPRVQLLVAGLLKASEAMLMFGMKLAAPVVAAFVVLAVILGVLARVLPEMNVLLMSFPLRVGLGLFLAAAMMPMMNDLTIELAEWMNNFLVS